MKLPPSFPFHLEFDKSNLPGEAKDSLSSVFAILWKITSETFEHFMFL
jgi:hypothetical protein